MFALYKKTLSEGKSSYNFVKEVHLFGRHEGYIPLLLGSQIPAGQSEPFKWHLDVEAGLARQSDVKGNALVIDVMPKNKEEAFVCELAEVWGHSDYGWTPLMFHLRGLIVFESLEGIDKNQFGRNKTDTDDPIFSMMYLRGSVKDGMIDGPWTPPGPAINSVFLWPTVFRHFYTEAEKVIKGSSKKK